MNPESLPVFFAALHKGLAQASTEVRRFFHGRGRTVAGLEQLTCDWIGQHLVVQLFRPVSDEFLTHLTEGLQQLATDTKHVTIRSISIQHRYEHGAPTQFLLGEQQDKVEVVESGLNYLMNITSNQNSGLFLDMRLGRDWVRDNAKGKNVLNLFAYTCGFSVAAIAGDASQVVNVDMARSSLNRGRENHHLNNQDLSRVKFLGHDIFKSWGKIKRMGPYDLIISDPPSFQKGSFALTKDYQKILRRLPDLLAEGGQVLACVNSPSVTSDFVIDGMAEHAPELTYVERLANPDEFADVDPEASLKVQLFRL
ncbi:methyltransferase [Vibrio sp. UCD-FRSSP16_10]|uniref:class I SAM-dependent methyltransferase n=1 Tax=unclassified Vibrio TaxID=2614977 RepID=UPI0007FFC2B7|nr:MULTISPECIES: class I SAM-dependent methyltransferase [unclassified Vibrio]OBT14029.1 methyltransferase [Vibrio sp. UCD-FRSSP16_30]OBT22910.1 methyltransferase [Vibrio sp. UCD-FRSSP16_10]